MTLQTTDASEPSHPTFREPTTTPQVVPDSNPIFHLTPWSNKRGPLHNATKYTVGQSNRATINIEDNDDNLPPEFLSKGETNPRLRTTDTFNFYMGASELAGHTFLRTLPAADPEGDAITWSISDPSGYFTIEPTTGVLKIKNTANPAVGSKITLNATVTSLGGTDTAVVVVNVATVISLKSIDFTTDHNKLTRNTGRTGNPVTAYAFQSGKRFHSVEWMASQYADPLTQSMSTSVGLNVILAGVPAGLSYDLVGDAAGTDLDFLKFGANGTSVNLTAANPLPASIGQVNKPISWMATIDGQTVALGDTQNLIYVTYGTPTATGGVVTEVRMDWLTTTAGGKGVGQEQEIVAAIHDSSSYYGVFELKKTPKTTWSLMDAELAECKDHVKLIAAAVAMLGVSGGKVGYVYPRLTKNDKGVVFYAENGALTEAFQNVLLRFGYQDRAGGLNNYEAVYEFTGPKVINGIERTVTSLYAGFEPVFDPTFKDNGMQDLSAEEVLAEALFVRLVWLFPNQTVQREAPRWP